MNIEKLKNLGRPQQADPYAMEPSTDDSKKKLWLMFAGVAVLLGALAWLLFGTSSGEPGAPQLKSATQSVSESVALLEEYHESLSSSDVKNDTSLSLILLRGNLQTMADLYNKTYKPKKKLSSAPKINKKSADLDTLDRAKRDNVLDSEITKVVSNKLAEASKDMRSAKATIKSKTTRDKIALVQEDVNSVIKIMQKVR